MIKKYLIICLTFFLFSNISLAEKVTVFNFTEEEIKSQLLDALGKEPQQQSLF